MRTIVRSNEGNWPGPTNRRSRSGIDKVVLGLAIITALTAVGCRPADAVVVAPTACQSGPATLWLDFAGSGVVHASADNSAVTPVQSRLAPASAMVPPFDSGPIAPKVSRDQAIASIVDRVRTLMNPYAVNVVTSRPSLPPYMRVLIGGTDAVLGGHSTEPGRAVVDCFNSIAADVAYDFAAAQTPELGGVVGIANIAAHEAGHTFGLEHVDNPRDIMYAAAQPMLTLPDFFTLSFGVGNFAAYGEGVRQCTSADPVAEPALLACNVGIRAVGGDSTPPTLAWDPPVGDVTPPLAIGVTAYDDVGVVRVEVYKNLELVASLAQPPYATAIDAAPGERFYVTIEAIDAAANRTTITRAFAAAR
jgi:hypothetical protein